MGKKLVITIGFLIIFLVLIVPNASAETISGHSAMITYNINDNNQVKNMFIKKLAIKTILNKYNSPIEDNINDFIDTCYKYDLDCYLLPAITGVESSFGRFIYPGSYNPFGWGRGLIMFNNWGEAIDTVGRGLRENYINKGANSVAEIGAIYCEGNTWAGKVQSLINQFVAEEEKLNLYLTQIPVKL